MTSHFFRKMTAEAEHPAAAEHRAGDRRGEQQKGGGDNHDQQQQPPRHQPLVPGTVLRSQRSTKIKVEANLGRDLAIFFVFVVTMLTLTLTTFSGVGHVDEETVQKRKLKEQSGTSKKRMWPGQRMAERFSGWKNVLSALPKLPSEDDRCNLYLADSSIPGAGFGLFAGKKIEMGSVVVGVGISMPIGGVGAPTQSMSQIGLIIKPHPTASNVKVVEKAGGHYFVATRTIDSGDELFIDMPKEKNGFAAAYYSLFKHVPTPDSYVVADDILASEMQGLTRKKEPVRIKKRARARGNKRGKAKETIDTVDENSLKVIKNIVARFDPLAAALLPENSPRLGLAMFYGVGTMALNNRTMMSIYEQGQCFDGVKPAEIEAEAKKKEEASVVVTRNVTEGEVIMSFPLYIIASETREVPAAVESSCLKVGKTSALFCPLSQVHSRIKTSSILKQDPAADEGDCEGCLNGEYSWSSWNPSQAIVHGMGVEKASNEFPVGLSLDIIAVRDIKAGKEILLDPTSFERTSVDAQENAPSDAIKEEL